MIDDDDWDKIVLLDWEWSGFGSPGIDLATWFCVWNWDDLKAREHTYLQTYWLALQREGVDIFHYTFENLWYDYLHYGTSHAAVRFMGFAGITAYGGDYVSA